MSRKISGIFIAATLSSFLSGCNAGRAIPPYTVAVNGDPDRGRQVIEQKGCGSCHMIPGIHNAQGLVGPPLILFSRRTMIAGQLPNSPDNLVHWISDPHSVEPKTAMPNVGLTDQQAHDAAAYLYTLR